VSYALRCYHSDPYHDHFENSYPLVVQEELRICFVCDSDKQFIVNCYNDNSIVTDINKFYLIKTKCFIKRWCSGLENILCWILDEFQNE
jgi:hypothetical protein